MIMRNRNSHRIGHNRTFEYVLDLYIAWAGEILGIRLIDHVIIGEDTFYSMKKENPGVSLTDIGLDQEEMDV